MKLRRAPLTIVIALVALPVLGAATAHAGATVRTTGFPEYVDYQATPGTQSRVTFDCQFYTDGTLDTCVVKDFEGVTPNSPSCVADTSTQVSCSAHLGTAYPVRANLGDLDDEATVRFPFTSVGSQIDAGPGDDLVRSGDGGTGDDVRLGPGDDWLDAGYGSDVAYGDGGKDTIIGGAQFNSLHGGDGNDTLLSGSGIGTQSTLYGENGNDYLQGGYAVDSLFGGAGDDILDGGRDADPIAGGAGFDTVDYGSRTEAVRVTFNGAADDGGAVYDRSPSNSNRDRVSGDVEKVLSGSGNDVLTAGATPVVFQSGGGTDTLVGGGGGDTLMGEAGNDVLRGGLGADTLDGGTSLDEISYSDRTVRVAVKLDGLRNDGADPNADRTSAAGEENDRDISIERIQAGAGPDYLEGNAASNRLRAGTGNDDVKSRDGTAVVDSVDCGPGTSDRIDADPSDAVVNCETPFTFTSILR